MSRNSEITKIKFYSINRDIKDAVATNSYDAIRIARKQFVSAETVRAVRRAGTWPKWQLIKIERNRRRIERAKAAIVAPRLPLEVELKDVKGSDENFALDLPEVWNFRTPIQEQVDELREDIKMLHERLSTTKEHRAFFRRKR